MDKTGYGPVITPPHPENDRLRVENSTIVLFHKE